MNQSASLLRQPPVGLRGGKRHSKARNPPAATRQLCSICCPSPCAGSGSGFLGLCAHSRGQQRDVMREGDTGDVPTPPKIRWMKVWESNANLCVPCVQVILAGVKAVQKRRKKLFGRSVVPYKKYIDK